MTRIPITIDAAGGEYMEAVLLLEWLVAPGDKVEAGQHICTVETAKAATEITAGSAGWIAEILVPEGEESPVGAPLGWLSESQSEAAPVRTAQAPAPAPAPVESPATRPGAAALSPPAQRAASRAELARNPDRVIASPLARRLAIEAGLALTGVPGTGPQGRIKRRDVLAALETRSAPAAKRGSETGHQSPTEPHGRPAAPLVLLHGFGADRTAFAAVRAALPPEIKVISLDLAGHGREGHRRALSIEGLAEDIADRLDALGLEEVHLAGHSLGGAVALGLAASSRISVRSLTLLSPGGLGPEVNGGFLAGLVEADSPEALEPWLKAMVAEPAILPPGLARGMLRQVQSEGLSAIRREMVTALFPAGTQGFDLRGALSRVTCPVRILWGREDRVIPADHARNLAPEVAVHLLPGVGHVPQMEAPELTARLIAQTIRSAGA